MYCRRVEPRRGRRGRAREDNLGLKEAEREGNALREERRGEGRVALRVEEEEEKRGCEGKREEEEEVALVLGSVLRQEGTEGVW